jgi:pilus assembly protein Flp/PilA
MMKHFLDNSRGATAIEYSLIAALISLAIIGGVTLWSDSVTSMFDTIRAAVVP